jgi:hypothetical protein
MLKPSVETTVIRTPNKPNGQGAKDAKKCNELRCLVLSGLGVLGGLLVLLGTISVRTWHGQNCIEYPNSRKPSTNVDVLRG